MKTRWVLLLFPTVVCFFLVIFVSFIEEDISTKEDLHIREKVLECALSKHAKSVNLLGVLSHFCTRMCNASVKPLFCNREAFLQKYGNSRFDFSQTPRDEYISNSNNYYFKDKVDVVYIATGERFYGPGGQSYVFDSIQQWRIFHSSSESRVFLVVNDEFLMDVNIIELQRKLDIILIGKSTLVTSQLENYQRKFYIQGYMHPGGNRSTGNKHFNQLVTERFFTTAAVMRKFNLIHILHLENDNMIYSNMKKIVYSIARCGYRIASTAPSFDGFVPGVIYIRDVESIEHFSEYVNDFLSCGHSFGVAVGRKITGKKDPYANDMTYMMNYYQLFGSSFIGELPAWIHNDGENCIVKSSKQIGLKPYLFDSASFGQWYSFAALEKSLIPPLKIQKAVKKRFLDITPPPYLKWVNEEGNMIPLWKGYKIVSLHIHAKNLNNFSSR